MDGSGDPAEVTSITVTVTEDGHRYSVVQATPDVLILEQIQPLTLTYQLGLPAQAGTPSAALTNGGVVRLWEVARQPIPAVRADGTRHLECSRLRHYYALDRMYFLFRRS